MFFFLFLIFFEQLIIMLLSINILSLYAKHNKHFLNLKQFIKFYICSHMTENLNIFRFFSMCYLLKSYIIVILIAI